MPHSGEEFGSDLVDLYDAGRYKLKAVAEQFRQAGGELFRTDGLTSVFARDPALGGTYGPAKAPWESLRDSIVDVILKTATNLDDTGLALMMAAEEYAKTDEAARARYHELKAALDRSHGGAGVSYEQLAQHAAQLEQSAIIMDMRQRGFGYDKGRFTDANLSDAEVQTAVDVTAARFAGVAEMFTPFLAMPDPQAFTPLAYSLARVASTLNSGQAEVPYNSANVLSNPQLGKIDDVKALVKDWYGGAALTFKDNFLSTWYPITSNQFALVIALKGGIEAERALWREARKNVDDLAHKAQAALDAMLDCNPKDVAFLLTVAGSIFAVGATVATGALGVGLTIVGEAAASAGAFPMTDPEKVDFSGKNATAIVNGVQDALNKLARQIIDAENVIRDAMNNAMAVLSQNQDRVIAPRPHLADTTASTVRDGTVGLGTADG